MDNKVRQTIYEYKMLSDGDSVVIGLSGGADSVSLLHVLCSLRDEMHLTVYACHVNHGLRGEEADRDERFAESLCKEWDVQFFSLHCNIAEEAQKRKIGTEQCGREVRYRFFEKTAASFNAKIATAHTASDNAETVLFNLARGSGISGLCGIPPVRDNIIRPLINVSRGEIEVYCRDNNLYYVTDSTNLTRDYNRNRIRLDVIPTLKEINPSLEATVSRFSKIMRETGNYLEEEAENALKAAKIKGGYRAESLRELPDAVFSAVVRKLCAEFSVIPEAKHIELMKKIVYNSGVAELGDHVTAVMKQGIFRIYKKEQPITAVEYRLDSPQPLCIANKKIRYEIVSIDEFYNGIKKQKFLFANSLDYGTIPLTSCFRFRKSGDSFSLQHRNLTKPVRKLFIEMKLPQEQRDKVVLLSDGSRVLWIEDVGVCRECAVTEHTKQVLVIIIDRD